MLWRKEVRIVGSISGRRTGCEVAGRDWGCFDVTVLGRSLRAVVGLCRVVRLGEETGGDIQDIGGGIAGTVGGEEVSSIVWEGGHEDEELGVDGGVAV